MGWLSDDEIERRRRSLAMLSRGVASGLTREEAMEILEELQRCRCKGRQLLAAVRAVETTTERVLRSLGVGPRVTAPESDQVEDRRRGPGGAAPR